MCKVKRNEKGIVLILALILMTLIFLLTLSAFEMVTTNIVIANNHIRDIQALYVAEAGIDHVIYDLRNEKDTTGIDIVIPFEQGSYKIKKRNLISGSLVRYIIESEGKIYNSTRTIQAEVRLFGASNPYTVLITSWKEI